MSNRVVQVPGNAAVQKAMEGWLNQARGGRVNFAAVVWVEPPNVMCDFGGNVLMMNSLNGEPSPLQSGLDALGAAVRQAVSGRAVPPAQEMTADYAVYDFTNGPASYDVFPWLIGAEMTRLREGAPGPLKVHWWMGDDRGGLDNGGLRRQIFENVMRPALALVGAVETDRIGRHHRRFTALDVVTAARAGEKVPLLRSGTNVWTDGPAPVTITLREMRDWTHRNSNLGAWLKFARLLKKRGERVIFVRDTARAHERLPGFETDPKAATDLHHRMALYEGAKANLFTTNGPTALATYGDRPYLQFIVVVGEDHPCDPDKASFWLEGHGLNVGEQWPWARDDQRLIWARDDFDTILAAWEELKL